MLDFPITMSLYPSLEDMKVDRLYQAQFQADAATLPGGQRLPTNNASTLPYPVAPSAPLYPSLADYMGLELSPAFIAENMPEYMPENQVATRPDMSVVSPTIGGLVAPLSANSRGLARAFVTNGVREMVLCKDGAGKIGLRVSAVNNGIFVALVIKDSPAAQAGLRFGDQVLQVQGKDMAGMSPDSVHDMIRKAPDSGLSFIVRDRPLERTVTLHKDSTGRVGFTFKNGKIMSLVLNSSAARNGLLTEHQMVEVNAQNVVGMKDKDITQIITDGGNIITVTVLPSFLYEHMTKRMATSLFGTMDHSVW